MGMRIDHDVAAMNAQQQTTRASKQLLKGFEQLASGLRINRAADDAAALAISEGMRSDVRQYTQEVNNLQSGVNMLQTAEGGLQGQGEALQRVRDLATQAANGALTTDQRTALNAEAQQLLQGIDQTAAITEFNGTALLNGSVGTVPMGTAGNMQVALNESTTNSLGVNGIDLTTQAGATAAMDKLDTALTRVSDNRAALGAQQNGFTAAISTREVATENTQAAESQLRDLDYARAVIDKTRNDLLMRTGVGVLAQANVQRQNVMSLMGA